MREWEMMMIAKGKVDLVRQTTLNELKKVQPKKTKYELMKDKTERFVLSIEEKRIKLKRSLKYSKLKWLKPERIPIFRKKLTRRQKPKISRI
jgi:hypothetical protein